MSSRLILFSLLASLAAAQLPGLPGFPSSVAPGLPGTGGNNKERITTITSNVAAVMNTLGTVLNAPNMDIANKNIVTGAIESLRNILKDLNKINQENGAIPVPEPIIPGVSSAPIIPGLPGIPPAPLPGQLPGFNPQPLGVNNGIGGGVIGQ